MNYIFRVLPVLLLLVLKTFAQDTYSFKNYRIVEGLPSNEVYQSIQDKEGNMWFATDRGVSRYDGSYFENFTEADGLTDDVVFGFFLEDSGRLWFYTSFGGLCYFEDDSIYEPTFNYELKKILKSWGNQIITSMAVNDQGTIWLGLQRERLIRITPNDSISTLGQALRTLSDPILAAQVPQKDRINLAYTSGKDQQYLDEIHFVNDVSLEKKTCDLSAYKIQKLHLSRLKMYAYDSVNIYLALDNKIFRLYKDSVIQQIELKGDSYALYAMLKDKQGDFWLGTREGVYQFNNGDLTQQPNHFLSENEVSSVFEDSQGGYWFTSLGNGVFYQPHFNIKTIGGSKKHGVRATDIISNRSTVCVGYSNKDLDVYINGDINYKKTYPYSYFGIIPLKTFQGLVESGAEGGGSYFIKDSVLELKKKDEFFRFRQNDDYTGFLWIQSSRGLLYKETERQQSIDTMVVGANIPRISAATFSKSISTVWLGASNGLWMHSKEGLTYLGDQDAILSKKIIDLDVISNSSILVTTGKEGIYLYNHQDGKARLIYHKPGINYNQSFIDSCGVVWVASFSGIFRITGYTEGSPDVILISKANGLPSNEIYRITQFKDQIWVAAGSYINYWNISWVPQKDTVKTQITKVIVNGSEADLSIKNELSFDEDDLQFYFNTHSFRSQVEYDYRLKGLHSNWVHTSEPEAFYSSLKPGDYSFEVKHWNENDIQISIPFSINPPLWLNPWLLITLGFCLVAGIFVILRIRYVVIRKENKLFKLFTRSEQKALRAQVNPHFLFNAFNSVSELMAGKKYTQVQRYMQRLTRMMRLVLRFSRKEEVSLKEEVEFLELFLEMEKLRFQSFTFEVKLNLKHEDSDLHLPSLFIQPYIENAIKHGIRSRTDNNGFLSIHFIEFKRKLEVRIADNGEGYQNRTQNTNRESYGMKINGERIDLFNEKENYSIAISALNPESKTYPGTIISLKLPIKVKKDENKKLESTNC